MTERTNDPSEYKVGYRRPPLEHQFKAGEREPRRKRAPRKKNYVTRRDALLDAPVGAKLNTVDVSFLKMRERALKDGDYRAILRIQGLDRERYEEEMALRAMAEHRTLEEHELA